MKELTLKASEGVLATSAMGLLRRQKREHGKTQRRKLGKNGRWHTQKNSPRPSLPPYLPTSLSVSLDQNVELEALFAVEAISTELSQSSEDSNPLKIAAPRTRVAIEVAVYATVIYQVFGSLSILKTKKTHRNLDLAAVAITR